MDDQDLCGVLADEQRGPSVQPHLLEAVLCRSRQIRRRGRALKALGASTLAAGMFGVVTLVGDHKQSVEVVVPRNNLPGDCISPFSSEASKAALLSPNRPIPVDEAEGLRLLPSFLPDGMGVRTVEAYRAQTTQICPLDPVLALRADGGDATIDATVKVSGPTAAEPFDGFNYGDTVAPKPEQEIELRGGTATLLDSTQEAYPGDSAPFVALSWVDANGDRWVVEAMGVDAETVRRLTESLVLDTYSSPIAELSTEDVPDGFEVVWQAEATSEPVLDRSWIATFGPSEDLCYMEASDQPGPPVGPTLRPGVELVTVRGQEAGLYPGFLEWQEPSGVSIRILCEVDSDLLMQMAESIEHIEADDPRLQPG